MTKKSYNISDKLDTVRKEVLILINQAAEASNCKFLVIGATARDIILKHCYNVKEDLRATIDLDVAIAVQNWESFNKIKNTLLEDDKFTKDMLEYRIYYEESVPVDLIPFGGIANKEGNIFFQSENTKMTILGFEEALKNAKNIIIADDQTKILVAHLENLFVMKLISWDEKYPERRKDATDMFLILKYYLEGDNEDKLYNEYSDILDEDNFDYELASARVLGRDIARTVMKETLNWIVRILKREISPDDEFRLIGDLTAMISAENPSDIALSYLESVYKGIIES
ncbi:MAG: hypothetical protein ABFS12_18275 [Bacteroidota bacterium]